MSDGIKNERAEYDADDGQQSQEKVCSTLVPGDEFVEGGGFDGKNGDAAEE